MGAITAELMERQTGEKRDARGLRVAPQERRWQSVQAYRASGLTMGGGAQNGVRFRRAVAIIG